jgi:hypothetical protein
MRATGSTGSVAHLVTVSLQVILFGTLCWCYTAFVADTYGYFGGFERSFSLEKAIFGLFAVCTAAWMVRPSGKPSYLMLHVMIGLVLTPVVAVTAGSDLHLTPALVAYGSFLLCFVLLSQMHFHFPWVAWFRPQDAAIVIAGIIVCYTSLVFFLTGTQTLNFDFSRVYELRRSAADNLPDMFAYFTPTVTYALGPLAIAISLHRRQYSTLVIISSCLIVLGALTNNRAPFFIPFLVLAIYIVASYRNAALLVSGGFVMVALAGLLDFFISHQNEANGHVPWIGSVAVWRAFVIPAQMNYNYWDFFSSEPMFLWAQSKLTGGIVTDPYGGLPLTHLIGQHYYGSPDIVANTGYLGSGMANAGYVGIVLYTVVIAVALRLMDSVADVMGNKIAAAVFTMPIILMTTTMDIPNVFLTGGFASLLIALSALNGIQRSGSSELARSSAREGEAS